jgi:hypothetical protein
MVNPFETIEKWQKIQNELSGRWDRGEGIEVPPELEGVIEAHANEYSSKAASKKTPSFTIIISH